MVRRRRLDQDGESLHFDYYSSFVMYPMLLEILEVLERHNAPFWKGKPAELRAQALTRTQRYCAHLERFISPQGTFPPIGRSLAYRSAAFQPLALLAWRKQLPQTFPEGQVRAAMQAMHKALYTDPGNFIREGCLTIGFVGFVGFVGHQPALADWLFQQRQHVHRLGQFLALGLPADDSYWTSPSQDWMQNKAFGGAAFRKDYPVYY